METLLSPPNSWEDVHRFGAVAPGRQFVLSRSDKGHFSLQLSPDTDIAVHPSLGHEILRLAEENAQLTSILQERAREAPGQLSPEEG